MATEVDAVGKQDQQFDNSQSTEWNVTTTKMLIEFYKENRILWDRNHKEYGKSKLQKRTLNPLVAKLERSNCRKSEVDIKKRWHNLRSSALRYFKKNPCGDEEVRWAYWDDMSFLREHFAAESHEEENSKFWSEEEIEILISFFQANECLWNHNAPSYHQNSQNKDLLYDMLSKELNDKYDTSELQKKWKELERKFKQEHSKTLVRPSGSGTDEIFKPTFPFFYQLQFLTSSCETDETIDSIEEPSNPKPRKRSKRLVQEDREERKLALMSEAIQAMKETPASTKKQDKNGSVENTEAEAFGTYVGITLSKLSRQKFRQAKKCIGDILYNIEESEDASASNIPAYDHQFDRQSRMSTPSSFDRYDFNPVVQYSSSYSY